MKSGIDSTRNQARVAGLLAVLLAGARLEAQPDTNATAAGPNASATNEWSEFSVQVSDGLGNPLAKVAVDVFIPAMDTNGEETNITIGRALSGEDGIARGVYAKGLLASNQTCLVTLSKSGYTTVTASRQVNYMLKRIFHSNDVARIAKLEFSDQNEQLTQLLAGEMDSPKTSMADAIFAHDSDLYPPLKRLINSRIWLRDGTQTEAPTDPYVGRQAEELLATIGNPADIRLMLGDSHTPNGDPAVNRWADALVSALLAPTSDLEWTFLASCANDDFQDHWVDLSGIRSLRLIASPQSLALLKAARAANPARSNEIASAIAYIATRPAPLQDRNLVAAAEKSARALDGSWLGNERPRYNQKGDKALVDLNFISGGTHYVVFTATFHQDAGLWKLRGVRVTKDTLLPKAPPKQRPPANAPAPAVGTRRPATNN